MGKSRVTIEQPTEKPKRQYTRRQKQVLTAKDIENYLVMGFSWVAIAKQAPWWKVDVKEDHIDVWSGQAAQLANRYLAEHAQKVKDGSDIASVGFGMLMLVYSRLQMDAQYRREMVRAKKAQLQQEEGIPEDLPQEVNQRTNGKVDTPIFGNGGI